MHLIESQIIGNLELVLKWNGFSIPNPVHNAGKHHRKTKANHENENYIFVMQSKL